IQSPLMISSRATARGARPGPGVTERAGKIPVRITLTWDFGPGAPARWLRMNKNQYATRLPVPRRAAHGAFSKFPRFSGSEERDFKSGANRSFIVTAGTQTSPALHWVKTAFRRQIRTVPFS